jgi:hypothetical protein
VIGDYTEEALSGHDIKVTGQIPYIPWAKIKGTHYYWDQSAGGSINGSILGVEVQLSPSSSIKFGQEDSNAMAHSGYAKLNLSFPLTPTIARSSSTNIRCPNPRLRVLRQLPSFSGHDIKVTGQIPYIP